jgi:hypothetical protein
MVILGVGAEGQRSTDLAPGRGIWWWAYAGWLAAFVGEVAAFDAFGAGMRQVV